MIPRFELSKGFDVSNAPPDNPQNPETFRANSVAELLQATLTPSQVVESWGMGKTLSAALLQGVQGEPAEGVNVKPLVNPDRSLVNTMLPVTYPSQAGRRT
jgi:hypothetical protein